MIPAAVINLAAVASHSSAVGSLLITFRTYKCATQEQMNSEPQLAK
jgi:hypothetical protein